jgi:hypothetical protein
VEALMESIREYPSYGIAVLGLIQPLAIAWATARIGVDSQEVLRAGGHRREAIERLQAANPEAFTEHFGAGVPVRSYDFDAAAAPENSNGTHVPFSQKEIGLMMKPLEWIARV